MYHRSLFSAFVSLLFLVPTALAEDFDPDARAAAIANYLDAQTLMVGHVDLKQVDVSAIIDQIAAIADLDAQTKEQLAPLQKNIQTYRDPLVEVDCRHIYMVVSLFDAPAKAPYFLVQVGPDGKPQAALAILSDLVREFDLEAKKLNDQFLFVGDNSVMKRIQSAGAARRPELAAAFRAAGDTAAQLLIIPSEDTQRVLRELTPRLPPPVEGDGAAITKGIEWAAVGVSVAPKLELKLVIQSKNEETARRAQQVIRSLVSLLAKNLPVENREAWSKQAAQTLTPQVAGKQLKLTFDRDNKAVEKLKALLSPPIQAARRKAARMQSVNNMKQLGIAMHNFHDAYGGFPPASSYDKEGNKQLSWRVFLLPFVDQQALYEQFHLDEPWDSEHNRRLIEKMPLAFKSPLAPSLKKGMTTYLAPTGEGALFHGKAGLRIQDIADGTSNTIMFVEAKPEQAVIWTKPEDLNVDLDNPRRGLGDVFNAALCDGSVHTFTEELSNKMLRHLFTPSGGEVVDFSEGK